MCDEVTSSVDAFAEKEIIDTLRSASAQRTTITVAHRLSSIAHSDQIIVLEKGRIVERGRHIELLQKENGIYRKMWDAQNSIDLALTDAKMTLEEANELEYAIISDFKSASHRSTNDSMENSGLTSTLEYEEIQVNFEDNTSCEVIPIGHKFPNVKASTNLEACG